ncbi:glycosyltransferase [Amycolatopsis sp. NPDC006131]|uniref:glycosyltransferase family 2 protein n=1 Tax=Amycolatopsis sp. NPDC006131 TaxID=3156731 RepID=UPI0033AC667D
MNDITVVVPTIPIRGKMLGRALTSIRQQTLPPAAIVVEYDHDRTGSAATRNRALAKVDTEWVAWLDDDDQFLAHHLETLRGAAAKYDADVVYSLPRVLDAAGNQVPRAHDWGGGPVFDSEYLKRKAHIQTTSLVKTEWARKVGGFKFITDSTGAVNDDHGFYLALYEAGARFHHVHEETFIWTHHGYGTPGVPGNTSGQPDRW